VKQQTIYLHSLIFKNVKPMVLPNNARALLRIVLRTVRNKYDSEEFKVFDGLETHMNEISGHEHCWEAP
jgi:hypothetical protein